MKIDCPLGSCDIVRITTRGSSEPLPFYLHNAGCSFSNFLHQATHVTHKADPERPGVEITSGHPPPPPFSATNISDKLRPALAKERAEELWEKLSHYAKAPSDTQVEALLLRRQAPSTRIEQNRLI